MSGKSTATPRTTTSSTRASLGGASASRTGTSGSVTPRTTASSTTKPATSSTTKTAASSTTKPVASSTSRTSTGTTASSAVKKPATSTSSGLTRTGSAANVKAPSSGLSRVASSASMSRSGITSTVRSAGTSSAVKSAVKKPTVSTSAMSSTPATPRSASGENGSVSGMSTPRSPMSSSIALDDPVPSTTNHTPEASPSVTPHTNSKHSDELVAELRATISDYQSANELLKMKEKKMMNQIESLNKQVEAAAGTDSAVAANLAHIQNLTSINQSLTEEVEILQLDKDQLLLDYELLEEKCLMMAGDMAELKQKLTSGGGGSNMSAASAADTMSSTMAAMEIEKLREALKRLNASSLRDRETLAVTTQKYSALAVECEELRKYKIQAEESIAELRETVDESSTYESMIESLTERNLELGAQMSQAKQTIRDMEEAQELLEELDGRQRAQMALDREEMETMQATINEYDIMIAEYEQKAADHQSNMNKMKAINKATREELHKIELSRASESMDSKQLSSRLREFALLQKRHEVLLSELSGIYNQSTEARTQKFKFQSQYVRMNTIFGSTPFFNEESVITQAEVNCASVVSSGFDACRNTADLLTILTGRDRYLVLRDDESASALATSGLLYTLLTQCQTHAVNMALITFRNDLPVDEVATVTDGDVKAAEAAMKKLGKIASTVAEQQKFLTKLGELHLRATQYIAAIRAAAPCKTRSSLDSADGSASSEAKQEGGGEDSVEQAEDGVAVTSSATALLASLKEDEEEEIEPNSTVVENIQGCRSVILELQEIVANQISAAKAHGQIHHPRHSAAEAEIGTADGSVNANHPLHTLELQYSAYVLEHFDNVAEGGSFLMGVQAEQLFITINSLCDIGYKQTHSRDECSELADLFKSIKIDIDPLIPLAKKNTLQMVHVSGDLRLAYQFLLSTFHFVNAGMQCALNVVEMAANLKSARSAYSCIRKVASTMSGLDNGGSSECMRFFPSLLLTNISMIGNLRVTDAQPQLREQYNQLLERFWSLITFGTNDLMIAQHGKANTLADVKWKSRAEGLKVTADQRLAAPAVAASGNILKDLPAVKAEALLIAAERAMVTKEQHQIVKLELDMKHDQLKISEHKCAEYQTIIHDYEKKIEELKSSLHDRSLLGISYDEDDEAGNMLGTNNAEDGASGSLFKGKSLNTGVEESASESVETMGTEGNSDKRSPRGHRRGSSSTANVEMSEFALSENQSISATQDMAEIAKRKAARRASLQAQPSSRRLSSTGGGAINISGRDAGALDAADLEVAGISSTSHDPNAQFHSHASKKLLLHESVYLTSQMHFWRKMAVKRITQSLTKLVDPSRPERVKQLPIQRTGSTSQKNTSIDAKVAARLFLDAPSPMESGTDSPVVFGNNSSGARDSTVEPTMLYKKIRSLRASSIRLHNLASTELAAEVSNRVAPEVALRARLKARSGMLVYRLHTLGGSSSQVQEQ